MKTGASAPPKGMYTSTRGGDQLHFNHLISAFLVYRKWLYKCRPCYLTTVYRSAVMASLLTHMEIANHKAKVELPMALHGYMKRAIAYVSKDNLAGEKKIKNHKPLS